MSKAEATIFVCVSCRQGDDADSRPGQTLLDALREKFAATQDQTIEALPVECLAVCKRPCTVALAADGKWTYVVGDLDAAEHVDELVDSARRFAAADNGIVPWKERPASFKKGVVSRTPPLDFVAPGK